MIPTNKMKKLVLKNIVKFLDASSSEDIWESCSNEISTTTETNINSLQIKELFFKEILPDLSYNNFGYEIETIEKIKRLNKINITKIIHFDSKGNIIKQVSNENFDGRSNDAMDMSSSMTNQRTGNMTCAEEQEMEVSESDGEESQEDDEINTILAKYRSSQEPILSQASEKMHSFRESQLQDVFGATENDPLSSSHNTDDQKQTGDYDAFDYLCDGGRISDIAFKFPDAPEIFQRPKISVTSASFDNTEPCRRSLKRKSNSCSEVDCDQNESEFIKSKRKISNSFHNNDFSTSCESETSKVGLESIMQKLDDDLHNIDENLALIHYGTKDKEITNLDNEASTNSKIIANQEVEKTTEEIVAEIQKRLDSTRDSKEINQILKENDEYLLLLKVPFILPVVTSKKDKSENKKEEKSGTSKKNENSQKIVEKKKDESTKLLGTRILKNCRSKLNYDVSQCSDIINIEDRDCLSQNDVILSGSHGDSITEVKDLPQLSQSSQIQSQSFSKSKESPQKTTSDSQLSEEEKIAKIQALIDSAEDNCEINKILKENDEYLAYLKVPFRVPGFNMPEKSKQKSREDVLAAIQKQLDATKDPVEINKILDDNDEFREYLKIPFIIPVLSNAKTVKQDTRTAQKEIVSGEKVRKQPLKINVGNNLQDVQNSSRTELSFILSGNIDLKEKGRTTTMPQTKSLEQNIAIDLTDDD